MFAVQVHSLPALAPTYPRRPRATVAVRGALGGAMVPRVPPGGLSGESSWKGGGLPARGVLLGAGRGRGEEEGGGVEGVTARTAAAAGCTVDCAPRLSRHRCVSDRAALHLQAPVSGFGVRARRLELPKGPKGWLERIAVSLQRLAIRLLLFFFGRGDVRRPGQTAAGRATDRKSLSPLAAACRGTSPPPPLRHCPSCIHPPRRSSRAAPPTKLHTRKRKGRLGGHGQGPKVCLCLGSRRKRERGREIWSDMGRWFAPPPLRVRRSPCPDIVADLS